MYNKVQAINKLLEDQGASVVQKKPGLGNRPALYGYLPQAVFSAIAATDSVFTNTVDHFEFTEKQAVVRVTVTLNNVSHAQFGESQIITSKSGFTDRGSAAKGAVTDAIQKALALFGIGDKAYRGELESVFNGKVSETIVDNDFEAMKTAAAIQAKRGIEESRAWWRLNLIYIQTLSKEQRNELVKILGGK